MGAYTVYTNINIINRLHKILTIFKKLMLKFSIFEFKGLFTRSVKNFVHTAYLFIIFFKQTFKRIKFSAWDKKFTSKKHKNARRTEFLRYV